MIQSIKMRNSKSQSIHVYHLTCGGSNLCWTWMSLIILFGMPWMMRNGISKHPCWTSLGFWWVQLACHCVPLKMWWFICCTDELHNLVLDAMERKKAPDGRTDIAFEFHSRGCLMMMWKDVVLVSTKPLLLWNLACSSLKVLSIMEKSKRLLKSIEKVLEIQTMHGIKRHTHIFFFYF